MGLEGQIQHLKESVLANPSKRGISMLLEAYQKYIDFLDDAKDHIEFTTDIVVVVDGHTKIRFDNDDHFSSWLEEIIHAK